MPTRERYESIMSLVLLLLIIVSSIWIAGCSTDPERKSSNQYDLSIGNVTPRQIGPETVYDVRIRIDGFEDPAQPTGWMLTLIHVFKSDVVLIRNTNPVAYTGTPGSDPQVWFEDNYGGIWEADVNDRFLLTGLDLGFQGATVHVFFNGALAGEIVLPDDFTDSNPLDSECQLTLGVAGVTSRTVGSQTVWDAHFMVQGKDPIDYDAPWSIVQVMVTKGSTTLLSLTSPGRYYYTPGSGIEAWYEEFSGNPNGLDMIDGFYITGIDEEYEGATFEVYINGELSGRVDLPNDFT